MASKKFFLILVTLIITACGSEGYPSSSVGGSGGETSLSETDAGGQAGSAGSVGVAGSAGNAGAPEVTCKLGVLADGGTICK